MLWSGTTCGRWSGISAPMMRPAERLFEELDDHVACTGAGVEVLPYLGGQAEVCSIPVNKGSLWPLQWPHSTHLTAISTQHHLECTPHPHPITAGVGSSPPTPTTLKWISTRGCIDSSIQYYSSPCGFCFADFD